MPGADLLFIRFCLTGPLLYIALQMIVEPARFVTSLCMLVCVLHDFQHRFEAFQRREPLCDPDSIESPTKSSWLCERPEWL
jgi:hypothetical protein